MKLTNQLFEVTEKDNVLTAIGKGLLKGTVDSAVVLGAIGTGCVLIGKTIKKGNSEEA